MNGNGENNFLYLNRDNRWLDFHWHRLELGKMEHYGLHRFQCLKRMRKDLLTFPSTAAGIAVGHDGTIYYSDPHGHRILKIDPAPPIASSMHGRRRQTTDAIP